MLVSGSPASLLPPQAPPHPSVAAGPSQLSSNSTLKGNHHPYHLTLVPRVGIVVSVIALIILAVLIILIRRKRRELRDSDTVDETFSKSKSFHHETGKPHEGTVKLPGLWNVIHLLLLGSIWLNELLAGTSSAFKKFSYKETKKATNNFSTIIGEGGFGTVYKAEFEGGLVAAVKRMNKISEQAENEFCREIELLARLHHRHLVALRGFCIKKQERFMNSLLVFLLLF